MKPEFYLECVNPEAKKYKHIYELDILEVRGKLDFRYTILWPEDSLAKVKAQTKVWAKQERVQVLNIKEVYAKPEVRKDVRSTDK